MDTSPLVLRLSGELLAYVVDALRNHARLYKANGMSQPSGVDGLVSALAFRASEGQPGTSNAGGCDHGQVEAVKPRLVSYDTAASMLDCSTRQVKRLVSDRTLRPVLVGGLRRLRISDIDAFIEGQA
ncbi:helix-turn-helix domain-containing protein [Nocardioides scoriae]|nr:helix-turn-helix domain-containing protein [Nocardioides scoriae]